MMMMMMMMMMIMMMMDELQSCHKVQGTARTRNSKMCHAVMSEQSLSLEATSISQQGILRQKVVLLQR